MDFMGKVHFEERFEKGERDDITLHKEHEGRVDEIESRNLRMTKLRIRQRSN